MIKHYRSKSTISVNAVLKSKKSVHIAFTAQSDGSSEYATDNEDIQYALEHHYRFGTLFSLTGAESAPAAAATAASVQEASGKTGKTRVKVSDLSDAKEYLADTFGISRTSLRSGKDIMRAAEEHHIEFEGL